VDGTRLRNEGENWMTCNYDKWNLSMTPYVTRCR